MPKISYQEPPRTSPSTGTVTRALLALWHRRRAGQPRGRVYCGRLRRAPDAERVLMYRLGLSRQRVAALVRAEPFTVGYQVLPAARLGLSRFYAGPWWKWGVARWHEAAS
jgi:hypothetical protein